MIAVVGIGKAHGERTLFEGVTLSLNAGSRYGLVGANGSGKSTFLRMLAGDEPASDGTISVPKRTRVGVLRQDRFLDDDARIVDLAMMGDDVVWGALEEQRTLLSRPEAGASAARVVELEEMIRLYDGYTLEARAARVLEGLGIPVAIQGQALRTLSGGFRLRVLLAQVLVGRPEVLLLDEPTNHLDILSIRWLEKFLGGFKGTAVVVSHDHRFLNNVCTHIVDVDYERVTVYKGNYDAFVEQKEAHRDRLEAEIEKNEKAIADHKEFIERFRAKPTKARQAKSKARLIERIVIDELPKSSRRYPRFDLKQRRHSGRVVLSLSGISKSFGENVVLRDVSLKVERGDRLAILGPNGIGKSTLLKIAMGQLAPDAGTVEWGYESHPGYFAQDHREMLEGQRSTVQSWLWDFCPGEPIGYVRAELAKVLFVKDDVDKPRAALSGGEGARLVFAKLAVVKPTVLVLDEPTNHLDLEGIEALAEGLRAYDGTLIFVSHDRWFVSKVATRILEIRADGMQDFRGSYEEYVERCGDDHLDVEVAIRQARDARSRAS